MLHTHTAPPPRGTASRHACMGTREWTQTSDGKSSNHRYNTIQYKARCLNNLSTGEGRGGGYTGTHVLYM